MVHSCTQTPPTKPAPDSPVTINVTMSVDLSTNKRSPTRSLTKDLTTPSSETSNPQAPIPHTPNNTPYKQIETRNQDSYSVATHNTFDPLMNTEQVKTAIAVLKNLEEANNHTSRKLQIADLHPTHRYRVQKTLHPIHPQNKF